MPRTEPRSEAQRSGHAAADAQRAEYQRRVIDLYLGAPDTPERAARSDWSIAAGYYRSGAPLTTVLHAIRLAVLRRLKRDPGLDPLEPIRSLAYFRPLIVHIRKVPHDPDYVAYIEWSYDEFLAEQVEKRGSPPGSRGF